MASRTAFCHQGRYYLLSMSPSSEFSNHEHVICFLSGVYYFFRVKCYSIFWWLIWSNAVFPWNSFSDLGKLHQKRFMFSKVFSLTGPSGATQNSAWFSRFKRREISIEDDEQSDDSSTSIWRINQEKVCKIFKEDWRSTICKIAVRGLSVLWNAPDNSKNGFENSVDLRDVCASVVHWRAESSARVCTRNGWMKQETTKPVPRCPSQEAKIGYTLDTREQNSSSLSGKARSFHFWRNRDKSGQTSGTWFWSIWLWGCCLSGVCSSRLESWKVAASTPGGVTEILLWLYPSGHTVALGSIQRLTEMSTRDISLGVEATGA